MNDKVEQCECGCQRHDPEKTIGPTLSSVYSKSNDSRGEGELMAYNTGVYGSMSTKRLNSIHARAVFMRFCLLNSVESFWV